MRSPRIAPPENGLVVNKADRSGADQTVRSLRSMLELGHPVARDQFVSHHGRLMDVAHEPAPVSNAPIWMPPQYSGFRAVLHPRLQSEIADVSQ